MNMMINKSLLQGFSEFDGIIAGLPEQLSLSIDSRTTNKNCIFFALKGELHDGHDFIAQALEQGALAAVVQTYHPALTGLKSPAIIEVDDPLALFSRLAHSYLLSINPFTIAITGSNGKTTSKEMLRAALAGVVGESHVFANPGNKNNHIGLPMSIFLLKPEHRYAIFEMGMNHAYEIAHLCQIVEPQLGLITNISHAHEGNFADGIDGVQKAKAELFSALKDGLAVINLDDARIKQEAGLRKFKCSSSFGWNKAADVSIVSASSFDLKTSCQRVVVKIRSTKELALDIPLPGQHHALNAAAVLAVILALELPLEPAINGIKNMSITKGRMNIIKSPRGFLFINDGYNANPASMTAGIMASLELKADRRIAVIGAMGELGPSSAWHHANLGTILAQHFDRLFICGHHAIPTVEAALKAGFRAEHLIFKPSSLELIEPLSKTLGMGDVVFIKGSQSANMAAVADALAQLS